MPPRLRILVVDDIDANRTLIERFVTRLGHHAVCARDGMQALAICRQALPDLVLMDVMMPGMDGHATSVEIRRLSGERWLPIIFLSARCSEAEQLQGLAVGDDYLTKPVNLAMLKARIEVMARIAEMQQRSAENAARLETYRENNEQELQFTRHVLDHIVGYSDCRTGPVKRWIKPARHLSGDVIAHAYSPSGTLNVLFADSTGHGLAAAISAVPAVDTFHSMTRRGYGLDSIVREINAKLHRLLPANRFVAAAVATIDPYRGAISVWNGGIPVVLFVTADGLMVREWRSQHPPLGILADDTFDTAADTWHWHEEGELIICSDGLIDAEDPAGQAFGRARLHDAMRGVAGEHAFGTVAAAVETHLDGRENHDDLSLAAIACTGALHQPAAPSGHPSVDTPRFAASNWSLNLCFDVGEIRDQTIQPLLTRWLNQLSLSPKQFGEVLLILNELCNNAIDHGLLQLDSRLKQEPDGYERYQRSRSERLSALDGGTVSLRLTQLVSDGARRLQMRVRDSGAGFDHQRLLDDEHAPDDRPHGRGIALVRRLADSLRYTANGTEAVVEYALPEHA